MCPFAQKTWIGLKLTGWEPFILAEIDLYGNKPASFLKLNPAGKVPVLVHKGAVITESERILDFLAECDDFQLGGGGTSDRPSLHAADLESENWWRTTICTDVQRTGKQAVLSSSLTPDLQRVLSACEGRVPSASPFLVGASVSLADVTAFPFLYRLDEEYGLAESGYPNLKRWLNGMRKIDSFESTVVSSWWWWW